MGILLAGQLAWTLEAFGGGLGRFLFTDAAYPLLLVVAAASCLVRATRLPQERTAWVFLGVAMLMGLAAELIWALAYEGAADAPVPSVADACWLAFYPLATAAILMLARQRIGRVHSVLVVDGLLGALVVATLAAALLYPTIIESSGPNTATVLTVIAYPIGDLVIVGAMVSVAALTAWRPGRAWLVLGAGMLLNAAASTGYVFAVSAGEYGGGSLFDWLYSAAAAVIVLGAWQQPPSRSRPVVERWQLLAPLTFASVALVILVLGRFEPVPVAAVILAALTLLVAVGRATGTYGLLRALAQSRRDALTDPLTRLGNRTLFTDRVEHALAARRRDGGSLSLLFLDLDDFKSVNDSLGHPAGDETLRVVARRVQRVCRGDDTVARLGGDELGVLIDSVESIEDAVAAAERLGAAVREPFDLDGHAIILGVSIGIALDTGGAGTVDVLLKQADEAMYRAKLGQSLYEVHNGSAGSAAVDRLALASQLRAGLGRRELELHFQPKVELRDGSVGAVEALVRWRHPERGLLSPAHFLEVADRSGQMKTMTSQVLALAAEAAGEWQDQGLGLVVAVNVPGTILRDTWLAQRVDEVLARNDLPGSLLALELTEEALMTEYELVEAALQRLTGLDVAAALDDFGTGHSSLTRLSRLPISELKVDRSFVGGMRSSESDLAIVRSTINLGHELGMRVVAEGVEDAETYRDLQALGCDAAQGYFMGRPMPAPELAGWIAAWESQRAALPAAGRPV